MSTDNLSALVEHLKSEVRYLTETRRRANALAKRRAEALRSERQWSTTLFGRWQAAEARARELERLLAEERSTARRERTHAMRPATPHRLRFSPCK